MTQANQIRDILVGLRTRGELSHANPFVQLLDVIATMNQDLEITKKTLARQSADIQMLWTTANRLIEAVGEIDVNSTTKNLAERSGDSPKQNPEADDPDRVVGLRYESAPSTSLNSRAPQASTTDDQDVTLLYRVVQSWIDAFPNWFNTSSGDYLQVPTGINYHHYTGLELRLLSAAEELRRSRLHASYACHDYPRHPTQRPNDHKGTQSSKG